MSNQFALRLTLFVVAIQGFSTLQSTLAEDGWPRNLNVVIENTRPLKWHRNGRLSLFVLPITGSLSGLADEHAMDALRALDERGIGYSVDWNHNEFEQSLAEGIRIARMQLKLGQSVAVNANACLYSFFDGSDETLHVDAAGNRFAETSFGGKLGCPFALEQRVPVIKQRVER